MATFWSRQWGPLYFSVGTTTIEAGALATVDAAMMVGFTYVYGQLAATGGANVTLGGTTLLGPGDLNGTISGGAGSTFTLNSATTFLAGATLGAGLYNVNINGTVTVDGDLSDVVVLNLNNDGGITTAGSLTGGGSLDVKQDLNWTGGTLGLTGGTTIEASGLLNASGPDQKTLGGSLTNESSFCTLGGSGALVIDNGVTLTNAVGQINLSLPSVQLSGPFGGNGAFVSDGGSGSIINVQGDTLISCNFTNLGYLSVSSGSSLTLSNTGFGGLTDDLDGELQLSGNLTLLGAISSPQGMVVDAGSGSLLVGNGMTTSSLTLSGSNDVVLNGNMEVTSTGTLTDGNLTNDGSLTLDLGSMSDLSSYAESMTGTLVLHAAQQMMMPVNSTLTVSGSAQLSGTLELDFDGGYVPTSGTTFVVVEAGAIGAHFDTTPDNMTPTYNATSVDLTQN